MKHDWEYKKLGDICDKGSSNISLNKIEDNIGEYALFGASGYVKDIDFYHNETPYIGIVKDGSGCGRVNIYPAKSSLVGTMQYIYPKQNCDIKFLMYLLQSLDLSSLVTGAAIPHIYFKDYSKFSVPHPPLSTQQAIVSELDSLSKIIADCKETLKDYDALEQSIFYDMFGDPVKNDKGWEVKKLGEVCSKISDGPFGSNLKSEHYVDKGIRVIRLQNIGIGEFINKDKVFISENHYNTLIKYTCNSGDIVVGTLGEPNLRACKIPSTIPISIHKADCVHIVPNTCSILSDYFIALLNIPSFVKNKSNASHGQTRGRISYGQIKEFNIPVPPLSLQQTFASKIEAIEQMKEEMKKALQEAETLFQARMDYWFN